MFATKLGVSLVIVMYVIAPAIGKPIAVRSPMLYSNNFDMFVPYMDHRAEGSMHFQNFDKFIDPHMPGNMELDMNESKFLSVVPLRAPKQLSAEERRIRSSVQDGDPKVERRAQRNFEKGTAAPIETGHKWENFDYDSYLA